MYKKQRNSKITAFFLLFALMLGLFPVLPHTILTVGATGVDITADFTDANFLAAVRGILSKSDTEPIYDDDVEGVEELFFHEKNIANLSGIEHFTGLKVLNLGDNQLTEIDVSNNINLIQLSVPSNQLTELDVASNTSLKYLIVFDNQLTELDVSTNTVLEYLDVYDNQLTTLDVSNNTELTWLKCRSNKLTALDVSKNTKLEHLDCGHNHLIGIDVSNNSTLKYLNLRGNQFTTLNLSDNTVLTELDVEDNQLVELDVSNNIALEVIIGQQNQLTELDVSQNLALKQLDIWANQLTSIDVSKNLNLEKLHVANNKLTNLDVSKNIKLEWLYCYQNQLAELDVSNNVALTRLIARDNRLTELDVSKNIALTELLCQGNLMTFPNNVIGWETITALILGDTFIFYPQSNTSNGGGNNQGGGTYTPPPLGDGTSSGGTSGDDTTTETTPPPTAGTSVSGVTIGNSDVAEAILMPTGVLQVTVTAANITQQQNQNQGNQGQGQGNQRNEVTINISGQENMVLTLPAEAISALTGARDTLVVITDFGTLTIPSGTLAVLQEVFGDEPIRLSIVKGSFRIALFDATGREIAWSDPENPITLLLPYELSDDENADYVVAVRVGAVRNIIIPSGVYKDGFVSFDITSTGTYNVIYNDVMDFADVDGHWAEEYIGFLVARGLLEAGENFGVDVKVTRAMFAVMFVAIERANLSSYGQQTFTDVAVNRWYFRAIEWAADVGIINGIGNDLFAPNRLVTREEMATMLNRYIEYKFGAVAEEANEDKATAEFADASLISDWAADAVDLIVELGIIVGKPGNIFDPKGITTKAEYATIFARLIQAFSK